MEWNSEHTQLQLICATGVAQSRLNYTWCISLGLFSHIRPFPTLKNLCDALRSHAVDQSRIALELQQQYQTRRAGLSAHAASDGQTA